MRFADDQERAESLRRHREEMRALAAEDDRARALGYPDGAGLRPRYFMAMDALAQRLGDKDVPVALTRLAEIGEQIAEARREAEELKDGLDLWQQANVGGWRDAWPLTREG